MNGVNYLRSCLNFQILASCFRQFTLYGEYSCRIQKAADAVRTKLNVSD